MKKTIKVPFRSKGYKVDYKVETIDLSMTPIQFINVYSVFVSDKELIPIIGDHFIILQNHLHIGKPIFEVNKSGNTDEINLKKEIAQQIMNNPTE